MKVAREQPEVDVAALALYVVLDRLLYPLLCGFPTHNLVNLGKGPFFPEMPPKWHARKWPSFGLDSVRQMTANLRSWLTAEPTDLGSCANAWR